MPRPTKGARLGGSASHQKHILANLAASLFEYGAITTTEAKAKRLRPYAEKLITHAKKGSLANRRQVLKDIPNPEVVRGLFNELAPKFSSRDGGYTRIIKVENRKGDNAPMALIQLVTEETVSAEADRATRVAASKKAKTATKSALKAKDSAPSETVEAAKAEAPAAAEEAPEAVDKAAAVVEQINEESAE